MRASLRPSRVKCADFAFFATRDYRAKSVAFKPRHQGEWNTGLRPVRPAGIFPAVLAAQFQQNSAERNTLEVCVLGAWRSSTNLGSPHFNTALLLRRRYLIESTSP